MKTSITRLLFIFSFFLGMNLFGQIQVPDDYSSIQDAIDNSSPNGVITVHNGTYTENLVIDKPITIRSLFSTTNAYSDIENTIIDANFTGSAIQMSDIDGVVHLIGFTVINGTGTVYEGYPGVFFENGAGLFVNNVQSLYLDNMIIKENHLVSTNNAGGGMYAEASQVNVYNTEVLNNSTDTESFFGEGAGFKFVNCNANIQNSVFDGNNSDGYSNGGTVYSIGGSLSVGNTIFNQNFGTSGGGVCVVNCNAYINDCNFTNNESNFNGSAIRAQEYTELDYTITVNNCNFNGNYSNSGNTGGVLSFKNTNANVYYSDIIENENGGGAGLVNINSNVVVDHCVISNNITKYITPSGYEYPHKGAGVLVSHGTLLLKNSQITDNECYGSSPDDGGGGLSVVYLSDVTIENCRISGNIADEGGAIYGSNSEIKIIRTLIDNNFGYFGSAIHSNTTHFTFINSDIVNNITFGYQAATLYSNTDDKYIFVNSILSNPGWNEIHKKLGTATSFFTFSHSNIRGLENGFINNDLISKTWLDGNIDVDPQFTDEEAFDYTLLNTSLLIDSGTDYLEISGEVLLDLDESDYFGSAPDIGVFENDSFLGLSDVNKEAIVVFPNPTKDVLNIVTRKKIDFITVFNTSGKLLIKTKPVDNSISLKRIPEGNYWMSIWSDGEIIHNKLIRKTAL